MATPNECPYCGGTNYDWEGATPTRRDEPGQPCGWRCVQCGAFTSDPDFRDYMADELLDKRREEER